jgi:hypothetical protein
MAHSGLAFKDRQSRRLRTSWSGRQKAAAALVALVLAGVIIGVIAFVRSHDGPAVIGPSASPPPVSQPAVTKGQKWVTGSAGKLLAAVNVDVGKVSAAERAGHYQTARALGAQLATDAKTALAGPMPSRKAAKYRSGLTDLQLAGTEIAAGEYTKASHLLSVGTVLLTKVTAAANVPVPTASPAQVIEPNGNG